MAAVLGTFLSIPPATVTSIYLYYARVCYKPERQARCNFNYKDISLFSAGDATDTTMALCLSLLLFGIVMCLNGLLSVISSGQTSRLVVMPVWQ
jgi:hypothetical protein